MEVPRIVEIKPKDGMILVAKFESGQIKEIDIKPYLEIFEPFKQLLNPALFNSVKVDCGGMGVVWNENIDLSRYDIWEYGV